MQSMKGAIEEKTRNTKKTAGRGTKERKRGRKKNNKLGNAVWSTHPVFKHGDFVRSSGKRELVCDENE